MARGLIVVLTIVSICLLSGCGGEKSDDQKSSSGDSGRLRIAVIPKGLTYSFWEEVREGAESAGRDFGVDVTWRGTLKEDDIAGQIAIVRDFTRMKVDGIVLAPIDDEALREPVEEAAAAGIPVIIIDSYLESNSYASFIATDNRRAGEEAGEFLAQKLDGQGDVALLRFREGSASTTERIEGFLAAIAKHDGITVVSSNIYGGVTPESAYGVSRRLLDSASIDGVFCPNESTTMGMLRALEDRNLAGRVRFVGFDFSDRLREGIKDDAIDGLIVQRPFEMGFLGVQKMTELKRGAEIEDRIDTGTILVTKETLESGSMN